MRYRSLFGGFDRAALARQRFERHGGQIEKPGAIVQRGRHRLRRAGERSFLRIAQHALELAHVAPAEEGDDEEHRQDEQQLGTDAELDARSHQTFQR